MAEYDKRLGFTIHQVQLAGKQVRRSKLAEWGRREGVRIIEQRRIISRVPLVVEVATLPAGDSSRGRVGESGTNRGG